MYDAIAEYARLVEKQSEIIRISAEVIDEMSVLLLQHISTTDFKNQTFWDKMKKAVELQNEV